MSSVEQQGTVVNSYLPSNEEKRALCETSDDNIDEQHHKDSALLSHPRDKDESVLQWLLSEVIQTFTVFQQPLNGILLILLPSFITNRWKNPTSRKRTPSGNITALDGLRGIACVIVYTYHWAADVGYQKGAGNGPANAEKYMHKWYTYWMWNGRASVDTFFVISGYVLMYKPLKQIHAGNMTDFNSTISSSILRRGIRLYIPPMVDIFIAAIALQLGAYKKMHIVVDEVRQNQRYLPISQAILEPKNDFFSQMSDAFRASWTLLNSFFPWSGRRIAATQYDGVIWSIPWEFRCSLLLFMVLCGTCRLRVKMRLLLHGILALYCIYNSQIIFFPFLMGMILAEIDLVLAARNIDVRGELTTDDSLSLGSLFNGRMSHRMLWKCYAKQIAWLMCFFIGVYINSVPEVYADTTPGYITLLKIIPCGGCKSVDSARVIGAILITWSVVNGCIVQSLFTNAVSQYLGHLSYAIYLLHRDVMQPIGIALLPFAYRYGAGVDRLPARGLSELQIAKVYLLSLAMQVPILIVTADLFWRMVDIPTVRLAKWLEEKMIRRADPDHNPKRLQ